MNNRNIIFVIHCCAALFLAIQAWVWSRFVGMTWLSDALQMMGGLFQSVDPLRITINSFLCLFAPVLIISFFAQNRFTPKLFILFSVLFAALLSSLYLCILASMNVTFINQQIWIYVLAGSMGGLIFGTILSYPIRKKLSPVDCSMLSVHRRQILGSAGLLVGSTTLVGSLSGPLYFWRNQHRFVDVELGLLKEGEIMMVEVANKPVWIIKRSTDIISQLQQENTKLLDPDSKYSRQPELAKNHLRSIRPEYLIVIGICTHLGCSPKYLPHGRGDVSSNPQFFCPCHGGVFDLAGRVFSNTPPFENMVIPDHEYLSENVVRLHFPNLKSEWLG